MPATERLTTALMTHGKTSLIIALTISTVSKLHRKMSHRIWYTVFLPHIVHNPSFDAIREVKANTFRFSNSVSNITYAPTDLSQFFAINTGKYTQSPCERFVIKHSIQRKRAKSHVVPRKKKLDQKQLFDDKNKRINRKKLIKKKKRIKWQKYNTCVVKIIEK